MRTAFLALVVFTLIAGDAWRYTIGWLGWGILVGLIALASVALLVVSRKTITYSLLPSALLAFLLLAVLSTAWSFYPGATALGATTTVMTALGAISVAITFRWHEIVRGLGLAMRFVLGLSILFELFVAVFVRAPLLPIVAQPGVDYANLPDRIPAMLFWSRNELFELFDGGKLQGILGNSALLSFAALVGIIVFALQLAGGEIRRSSGIFWLAVAGFDFVASRSATNIIGLVAVAAVTIAVLLVRRAATARMRALTYGGIAAAILAAAAAGVLFWGSILRLLGKSDDLTNRTEIWHSVIGLAQQRPTFGWGWVSYWVPWVEPFTDLAKNNGIRQLHAHNAWLDVWFQLGVVGVVIFGALVLSTLTRSWWFAVDRPRTGSGAPGAFAAVSLLPLLLVVALLVQSFAESRILVEFGFFALVLSAVITKARAQSLPSHGSLG
ncbi:hypothetical protein BH11ACT5_BH11ACT5_14980 [soil metagenome]